MFTAVYTGPKKCPQCGRDGSMQNPAHRSCDGCGAGVNAAERPLNGLNPSVGDLFGVSIIKPRQLVTMTLIGGETVDIISDTQK